MKKAISIFLILVFCTLLLCSCGKAKQYTAEITIENYGVIVLELDAENAPITVNNFVKLAREGFYDGLTFHRIMEGFMMQGGDPNAGDPYGAAETAETIKGEFTENGVNNSISHVRGVISMARAGYPDYYPEKYHEMARNSASSQFFIVHKDSTFLDGKYAAFGRVISGIEVVDAVCTDAKPTDNNGTIPKDQQPIITSIKITES